MSVEAAIAPETSHGERSPSAAPFPAIPLALAVALGAVAFAPAVRDMWGRWMDPTDYYGYGPFVPLISAALVWRDRVRLVAIARGSSALGLTVTGGAVLLLILSLLEDIHFTQGFALCGAALGTVLVLFGLPLTLRLWFPLVFLAAMVPLPQVAIAQLTFRLKIIATHLAVGAIRVAGVPVVQEGSTIHMPNASVMVEDVCSGLRTLFALIVMATIFAYLEPSRRRALITVALAVPIAIAANVVRILVLCYLAAIGDPAPPGDPRHEAAGLAVYAVALGLLMALRRLPVGDEARDPVPTAGPSPPPAHGGAPAIRVAALLAILACGAGAAVAFAEPAEPERTTRTAAVPGSIGAWIGTDLPVAPNVYPILGTRDVLMRTYVRKGRTGSVEVYVVHASDARKVAHPPEICFSGGGYTPREHGLGALPTQGGEIEASRLVLAHDQRPLIAYFFYRLDGRNTASYLDHQFGFLLRGLRRERREGSMIRLSSGIGRDGLAGAEERIRMFSREALEPVLAVLR